MYEVRGCLVGARDGKGCRTWRKELAAHNTKGGIRKYSLINVY